MNMMENGDELRGELLTVVQSLRTRIQLDMEMGRFLSYLRAEDHVISKKMLSTSVENNHDPVGKTRPADRGVLPFPTLEDVRKELGDCQRCPLGQKRTNLVFGEGNPDAALVFVGEAPGADEDIQGRPFVGRAGQLLTKIITAMGLSRKDVYICNILKCRPPGNRNPKPEEIHACEPFLIKQLQAVKPEVICALGTFSAQTLLKTDIAITLLRGRFHAYQGIKLMPTYHPAYLLRNQGAKKQVWEDMQMVMKILEIHNKEGQTC
jgi:uracil-DNA glycosylase